LSSRALRFCHSERSEESLITQGKLPEGSPSALFRISLRKILRRLSAPQNDILVFRRNEVKQKKIRKKTIEQMLRRIQKSTDTLSHAFIRRHDRLRRKYKWYYKWHTIPYINYFHWFVFICFFGFLAVISFQYIQISRFNKTFYFTYTILGQNNWTSNEKVVNVKIEKGKVQLETEEDKDIFYPIGELEKKIDLGERVIWKNISWQADVPSGTKIKFKIKGANQDSEEVWELVPWIEYSTSGSRMTWGGYKNLNPKYRYLLIKIILESDGENTPLISRLDLSYKPEEETVIGGFIKEKIRKYLPILFQKIYESEKIL
jgi:hypothetical protein